MARSDLLVNLVKAASNSDQRLLRHSVEAIVAEERGKQHNVLADRLQRALASAAAVPNGALRPSEVPDRSKELVTEIVPRRRLDELVLPDLLRQSCQQLIEEQQRADLLRSHSLEPRHRVLLVGPPGNGKTTLAEALAEALAVPLFVVRYESIIASYLGETAGRLRRVFDYARTRPCVLFFDEFDAVGKERGDTHETGEIKRVVTSLLMQIDDLPSYTVTVAATNHSELLDRAVWRRFQLRLELPEPTVAQVAELIGRLLSRLGVLTKQQPVSIARRLGRISFAEAEEFCLDVLRRQVLAVDAADIQGAISEQLRIWSARVSARAHNNKPGAKRARASSTKTASRGRHTGAPRATRP